MDQKTILYSVVALVAAIYCIFQINENWLKPTVSIPPPKSLPLPSDQRIDDVNKGVSPDPFINTKKTIHTPPSQPLPDLATAERNPFLWPGPKMKRRKPEPTPTPEPVAFDEPEYYFNLAMIIEKEGEKTVLINNVFAKEGSRVSGFFVDRIEANYVLLSKGDESDMVWLPKLESPLQKKSVKSLKTASMPYLSKGRSTPSRAQTEDSIVDVLVEEFIKKYEPN